MSDLTAPSHWIEGEQLESKEILEMMITFMNTLGWTSNSISRCWIKGKWEVQTTYPAAVDTTESSELQASFLLISDETYCLELPSILLHHYYGAQEDESSIMFIVFSADWKPIGCIFLVICATLQIIFQWVRWRGFEATMYIQYPCHSAP